MHVSRVLAPVAVVTSLLIGTLGASFAPADAVPDAVASPATVAVALPSEPVQPAQSGSSEIAASYDTAASDAAAYDDASETRVIAALQPSGASVPDFGVPPSGSVPVLFNDRHVYTKPDRLVRGRLLAALVRDGTILVPLRALFGQLGASVSYDAATKVASAHRAGTEIKLTVGKPVVTIDGVARPLDVPPMEVDGVVLVPVRVIAEVFGAYVQWLPDKRAVVVRYLSSTAVAPAPVETPVPLAVATALPTPRPRQTVGPGPAVPKAAITNETFIAIDPIVSPRIANAFAPGNTGASGTSYELRGVDEFNFFGGQFEINAQFTKVRYGHATGYVTTIGGTGSTVVPAFIADDYDLNGSFGVELSPEKFYLGASYATVYGNYGYPRLGGVGLGLDKLPVLDRHVSYEGSFYYYPNLTGHCSSVTCPSAPYVPTYKYFRYSAGLTALIGHKVFVEAGYQGDKGIGKADTPSSFTHSGVVGGLGVRF